MISGSTIGILLGSALVTSFLSGMFGMAGGMILMGVMTWLLTVQQAMILHGITQLASNGYRCILNWRHIHWPILRTYFGGALLCVALFTYAAFVPDKVIVFLVLGLLPFANYLPISRELLNITLPGRAPICGFVVTAFQLTAGVSGPMLDIFYVNTTLTRHQVVATKAITQTAGHFIKLVYFAVLVGDIATAVDGLPWWLLIAVMPVAFAGTQGAKRFLDGMSDDQFRSWSRYILSAIGLVYIFRAADLYLAQGL